MRMPFKILAVCILFVFSVLEGNGQNEPSVTDKIGDSVGETFSAITNEDPLDRFERLTRKHFKNNHEKAIRYSKSGLNESRLRGMPDKQLFFLKHLSESYVMSDSLELAVKYSGELLRLSDRLNVQNYNFNANKNLGSIYTNIEFYDKSFGYYEDVLEIDLGESYNLEKRQVYQDLSKISAYKKDFKGALRYLQSAYAISANGSDTADLINNLWQQHDIFLIDRDELNAIKALDTARFYFFDYQNKELESINFDKYARYFYNEEEYKIALKYSDSSILVLDDDEELKSQHSRALIQRAQILEKTKAKKQQISEVLKKSTELAMENRTDDALLPSFDMLYKLKKEEKDFEEALHYKEAMLKLEDSLAVERTKNMANKANLKFTITQNENKIAALIKEGEYTDNINAQIKKTNFALGGLGGFALLTSFLLFLMNRRRKAYNKKLKQEVAQQTGELKDMNKELSKSNYELKKFNHIISHDLKEPIRNIISFTGLANKTLVTKEKNSNGNADLKEYIEFANESAYQLNTLVEDILEFAKNGMNEAKLEKIDLNELMEEVKKDNKQYYNKHKVHLTYGDMPVLNNYRAALYIVFKNVIENGIKYNESGNPKINLTYQDIENKHRFVVKDNGIGIEKEYWEKVFGMFTRLHSKGEYSGTGLGLANVRKILHDLRGSISILNSIVGKGTEILIELPKNTLKSDLNGKETKAELKES